MGLLLGSALGGAALGAGTSALATIGRNQQAAALRGDFRRGLRNAENVTASQVLAIANDPFNQAARNFVGGLFGVDQFAGGAAEPQFRGETGVNIGGRVFFTDPGRGFGGGLNRKGKQLGRRLAKAISTGNDTKARGLLDQFAANKGIRTSAIRGLQKRGLGLADVNALDARLNPQMAEAQAQTSVSAGGTQGTSFDPFTQNIAKQLNQQLALGGLGSGIGENVAAALGTGVARTQFQLSLLPQLQQFAGQEQQLRSQLLNQNAQFEVQRTTGGVGVFGAANPFQNQSVLGNALQGGLAGLGAGAQIGLAAGLAGSSRGSAGQEALLGSFLGNSIGGLGPAAFGSILGG